MESCGDVGSHGAAFAIECRGATGPHLPTSYVLGTTSTVFRLQLDLSDIDRGVYETLDLRMAQHASEEPDRLIVRALARAVAHCDGLEFGRGLSHPDDAALWAHDLTGQVATWIEVGLPSAERLHRISKRCPNVIVFTAKPEDALLKEWRRRKIHKAEAIQVFRLPPDLVNKLAQDLKRKVSWFLTIQDHTLTVTTEEHILEGPIEQVTLGGFCSTAHGS